MNTDERIERLRKDHFTGQYTRKDDLAALLTRHDELEAANAKFAVRINSCEHMLSCYRVGRRPSEVALDRARETGDAVDADPICSAAIEKARKQGE